MTMTPRLRALAFGLICALVVPWRVHSFPICLVQNPGFAVCDPSNSTGTFTGYDVDLIRWIANNAGWVELVGVPPFNHSSNSSVIEFYFQCTTIRVAPLLNILVTNGTFDQCGMGAGAITVTQQRWAQGVRFSYPYYRSGLGVLVSSQPSETVYNPWAFLKPFHWTIWTALLLTLVCVPIIIWVVENLVQTGSLPLGKGSLEDWRHAIYTLLLTVFNLECLTLLSLPSQMILVCFCFLNLVIVSTYTANLAAALTTAVAPSGITQISELRGRNVAAHDIYVPRLAQNDFLTAQTLTWNGSSTFLEVMDMLLAGTLDAYIFDKPILQYWKNNFDEARCGLSFVGDYIEPFDYGVAFHKDLPSTIAYQFQLGVLSAQASAVLVRLEQQWVPNSSAGCGPLLASSAQDSLHFQQISGLWIILGCAIFVGLLTSIYSIYHFHYGSGTTRPRSPKPDYDVSMSRRMASMPRVKEDMEVAGNDASLYQPTVMIASADCRQYPSIEEGPDGVEGGGKAKSFSGQMQQYDDMPGLEQQQLQEQQQQQQDEEAAGGLPGRRLAAAPFTPYTKSSSFQPTSSSIDDRPVLQQSSSLQQQPRASHGRTMSGALSLQHAHGSWRAADGQYTDGDNPPPRSTFPGLPGCSDSRGRKRAKGSPKPPSKFTSFAKDLASKVFVKADDGHPHSGESAGHNLHSAEYFDPNPPDWRLYYSTPAPHSGYVPGQHSGYLPPQYPGPIEMAVSPFECTARTAPAGQRQLQQVALHQPVGSASMGLAAGAAAAAAAWAGGSQQLLSDFPGSGRQQHPFSQAAPAAAASPAGRYSLPGPRSAHQQQQQAAKWQHSQSARQPQPQPHFRPALGASEGRSLVRRLQDPQDLRDLGGGGGPVPRPLRGYDH